MAFVRGEPDAADFWSFVEHCRNRNEEVPLTREYYNVVYGPVAMRWGPDEYEIHPGLDQISFHGSAAQKLLRDSKHCVVEVTQ